MQKVHFQLWDFQSIDHFILYFIYPNSKNQYFIYPNSKKSIFYSSHFNIYVYFFGIIQCFGMFHNKILILLTNFVQITNFKTIMEYFPDKDWEIVRLTYQGQKRTMCKCKKFTKVNGRIIKCNYMCRLDRPKDANHECTFNNLYRWLELDLKISDFQKFFCCAIARTNMSFASAASPEMCNFIREAIREGQRSILRQLPNANVQYLSAETIFPLYSRQTLTKTFNSYANIIRERRLENFKFAKYACLAIDAGMINGVPILDITLCSAFNKIKPLLLRAIRNFGGTQEEYIYYISDAINQLNRKSITITAIVGDNLIAQKSAFSGHTSMQSRNPESILAIPIWFPCICHTLSLGLKDAIQNDYSLSYIESSVNLISIVFRAKPMVQALGIVCPSFCKTRWTIIYDIFHWILVHAKTIEDVFMNPPPSINKYLIKIIDFPSMFYDQIPMFFKIFGPVRDLITFLEGDNTPAVYVYPVYADFINKMEQLINKEDFMYKDQVQLILNSLSTRIQAHYSFFLLRVLFYLTPSGRDHARKTIFSDIIKEQDENIFDAPIITNTVNTEEEINKLIQAFSPTMQRCESMKLIFSKINSDESFDSENEDEDLDDDVEIEDNISDESDESTYQMDNVDQYLSCVYSIAENYHRSMSSNHEENMKYAKTITKEFLNWIVMPVKSISLKTFYDMDPEMFWGAAKKDNPNSIFPEFVLRLLPIVASEATVERKLCRQRLVSPPDRSSTSESTQLNRVLLATQQN